MAELEKSKRSIKGWVVFFKSFVFRLSLREKSLALVFILALLSVWASMQLDRHLQSFAEYRSISSDLNDQEIALNDRERIEALFAAKIAEINLEELPTRDEVNASIDEIVRKRAFGGFKTTPPKSDPGTPLTFHSYSASIEGASYEELIAFTKEIRESLNYVSLRRIVVQAQRSNDRLLDAKLELKSIEYTK